MGITEVISYRCSDGLSYSTMEKAEEHEREYIERTLSKKFEVLGFDEIRGFFIDDYHMPDNSLFAFSESTLNIYGTDSIRIFKFKNKEQLESMVESLQKNRACPIYFEWKDDEIIYIYDEELYFNDDEESPFELIDLKGSYQMILPISVAIETKLKIYEKQNIRYIEEILNPALKKLLEEI